ncbi:MAG: inner membrane protein [Halieaceae bacterium]|jgi:inner membrane protein
MDPITQGALGAALPQSVARKGRMGLAILCGVAAGMAPDLDVLIRSADDPLLFLEYHRQFTHSLIFIPVGAGLVAACLWLLLGRYRDWPLREMFFYCLLGYATHALLDACTTYGTMLLWPFSDRRFAWNSVSIIDPLLTLPLLALVGLSRWRRWRWPAALAMVWVVAYLLLGTVMRDRAQELGRELAVQRGHLATEVAAKPSFANILLWKTVYREDGYYYVDAVRLGPRPRSYPGRRIAALDLRRDFPWLDPQSVQGRDVERFRWFSNGYLAADPRFPKRIMDLRYSLLPNEIRPLWSIELDPDTQQSAHVRYLTHREREPQTMGRFRTMLAGRSLAPEIGEAGAASIAEE